MAHLHSVYDTDLHFIIDPVTRKISSESGKVTLMQNDHNSERFTFQIPRTIEGHDMMQCNVVEVHYVNQSSTNKADESIDVYPVTDLQISPNAPEEDVVIGSWLVSQNATTYSGQLHFVMRFACIDEETSEIQYQWFTDIYSVISIAKGIYNVNVVTDETYSDTLAAWKREIMDMAENLGMGDMLTNTYDPQGKKTDIFTYVDNAVDSIKSASTSGIKMHNIDADAHMDIRNSMGEFYDRINSSVNQLYDSFNNLTPGDIGAYTKEETLSDSTREKMGLDAVAIPDEAFVKLNDRFNSLLLRPVNPVEIGPYDVGEDYFIGNRYLDPHKMYWTIMDNTLVPDSTVSNTARRTSRKDLLLNGRYSYGYYDMTKAYKLDHVNKSAELLCDLSSYVGSTEASRYDGIIAVDDQYIYFVHHEQYSYNDNNGPITGTIIKFDHSGATIDSATETDTTKWVYDRSGKSEYYDSVFNRNDTAGSNTNFTVFQTKNYIVVRHQSTTKYSGEEYDGSPESYYKWYFTIVSKNSLRVETTLEGYKDYAYVSFMYDRDLMFILSHPANGSIGSADSHYVYDLSNISTPIVNGTSMRHTYDNTYYYPKEISASIENLAGGRYYKVWFYAGDYDADGTSSYTVVSAEDFNTSTGLFTIKYMRTKDITLDDSVYDPVLDEFHCNGVEYGVYPRYIAPNGAGTINERFTAPYYFRADGYYYFVRSDGKIYKCKDEQQYVIDRVVVQS